jgi:EpsD family peptidyl-prolyl cis-trans isomerase
MLVRGSVFVRTCQYALLIGLSGTVLAACNQETAAPKGQVIARIGNEDVTQQELENELRWAQVPADRRDEATVKRVLGDLVQRKYLVQKAMAGKLDREPSTLLDLLRSREQILATSYTQREAAARSTAIGKADIDKYILSHPLMFERRQLLTVDKISIAMTPATQTVVEATKNMKSLEDIEKRLKEMSVLYNRSMGSLSTGDIPEEFYNVLKGQKPDDVFFVPTGATGTFFRVKGAETTPMKPEDAARIARQALVVEIMRREMRKIAETAQAEAKYEGDYADIMSAKPASAGKNAPEAKK